jgi:NAD(P)H-hydrate epimerase
MNAVDARGLQSMPIDQLVARAGFAVAMAAVDMLGGAYGRRVVVIAGRGNNGADGRVAAAVLTARGARVRLVGPEHDAAIGRVDLVIDAAYGTGFRGSYETPGVPEGTKVLAVDIPSGVEGDTGHASGSVLAADRTVTFVAAKPGLVQGDGLTLAGSVSVVDIGLPTGPAAIWVMEDADVADLVPTRSRGGNKWSAAVLVVAGSPGMTGAAALSTRAAYRSGAGMVRLGVPGGKLSDSPMSEAVGVSLESGDWADDALEAASRCAAVVVGPGLGRNDATAAQVRALVAGSPVPVVVDADGLYALGELQGRGPIDARSTVVLTPHDGEYQRLMGEKPGADRIRAARRLAEASGAVALLKGPTTAVAGADGHVLLGMTGTARLATAGTGDVLSGVIGALMARGVDPHEAAALAAHVHGRAAERGRAVGLVAGDLPELVSDVLASLCPPAPARNPGTDG